MPCARDELGGAGRPAKSRHVNLRHSVYIMHPLYLYSTRSDTARAVASCFVDVLLFGLLPAWMLQAWMLQDAPNHRGTERRGYGAGGNAKGPAAQSRRPNKGHIGYGNGENETELDALYRALRGERESCSVCALPVMTD